MFERFSQRARRVVFFARNEAGRLGSPEIQTEHLLLGILQENSTLNGFLAQGTADRMRQEMEERFPTTGKPIPVYGDLPLSVECRDALAYGAEEAERLHSSSIDTVHLAMGLLRLTESPAAALLRQNGVGLDRLRGLRPRAAAASWTEIADRPVTPRTELARRLDLLVWGATEHFREYLEEDTSVPLPRHSWRRKEALGHLIDRATAHHQWIVRALTEPKVVAAGYPGEEWVTAQQYAGLSWAELEGLWARLNYLLVYVLDRVPEARLAIPCRIGIADPVPLSQLVEQYLAYCEEIIGQILVKPLH